MTQCKPRMLTNSIRADVRRFYADEAGRCPCVVTDTQFGPNTDISHLDDQKLHSYRHNLVPLHPTFNRHFGALMSKHGSPTKIVVPCQFTQLDWDNLRGKAQLHREQWRFRRAYACVRVGYYTITRYYGGDLGRLYDVMAECLYFARHVWDEDLIWALSVHDLVPLLERDTHSLRRAQVSPVVRQIAALWTDLRDVTRASMILSEHDVLLGVWKGDSADKKTQCSLLRRRGMDAVTREGVAGLVNGAAFAKEALSLAVTLEEQVNALEVEPWLAEDRDKWPSARKLLEEGLVPKVLPHIQTFAHDLRKQKEKKTLGTVPLKIPAHLTPLNAAQVPMDYAVSIVKTGARRSKRELREVRRLVDISMAVYDLMGTRPFMLTENVKTAYEETGRATGDKRLQVLAAGRGLLPHTLEVLMKVSKMAVDRLRDAKS